MVDPRYIIAYIAALPAPLSVATMKRVLAHCDSVGDGKTINQILYCRDFGDWVLRNKKEIALQAAPSINHAFAAKVRRAGNERPKCPYCSRR